MIKFKFKFENLENAQFGTDYIDAQSHSSISIQSISSLNCTSPEKL